jgi:hypothetical protein
MKIKCSNCKTRYELSPIEDKSCPRCNNKPTWEEEFRQMLYDYDDGKFHDGVEFIDFTRKLLEEAKAEEWEECIKVIKKLWLKGVDHPYNAISYNCALRAAIEAINKPQQQ